ncbi:MAG: hypothetical protein Q9224_001151 [Gallowayella concinna]
MLKSTHKPVAALPPLPTGWTEHKAPTGASAKEASEQSTYTRPSDNFPQSRLQPQPTTPHYTSPGVHPAAHSHGQNRHVEDEQTFRDRQAPFSSDFRGNDARKRSQPKDRPKFKHIIPGCEPWVLVITKLGRRFVHNLERNESFWKFPPDVMKAVIEYDKSERESKAHDQEPSATVSGEPTVPHVEARPTADKGFSLSLNDPALQDKPSNESDEYEEVEVTDDEEDDESNAKRQKMQDNEAEQPVEFDEDDIAYQLAAMGQDYGLDPGEYGNVEGEQLEEGAEGLPLSEEDASALFKDMLDDHHISPYNPWEKLVDEVRIIEDDRYTLLPNMRTRKEVWGEWGRERIQMLKEQREKEEKKDPLIPYLEFLQAKATPKLYWPEFRRKYMKEQEMRNTKLSDKEREKWYRDYINRLKLPESTLKSDLVALLKSMPLQALNRSTPMAALPPAMLTNMRYIALRPSIRDPLIETHISTLPEAPDTGDDAEEQAERTKQKQEREQRKALAERQLQVQKEKSRAREAMELSKGRMQEGEREVQQAMRVGKEGLLAYMGKEELPPLPPAGDKP